MQYKSSFFLFILKFMGFFWCEKDYCIPSSQPKKYNVFFFIPTDTFEVSYDYDTQTDMPLVSPTIGLTHAPYNLFGKPLFSHFHTEPLFRPGNLNLSKNFIIISDN